MNHKLTEKRFLYHKIRHRYLKQNKSPAQIADEMPDVKPGRINWMCDVILRTEV